MKELGLLNCDEGIGIEKSWMYKSETFTFYRKWDFLSLYKAP